MGALRQKPVELVKCETVDLEVPASAQIVYRANQGGWFEAPMQGRLVGCLNKECGWQKWDAVDKEGRQSVIEVKVEDTGCGISKEDLSRIFDPFYSTKGQKGTGLGLAVIWGIIDNHDGAINVSSELNKGTVFTIHLPL